MSTYISGEIPQVGDKVVCIRGDIDFLTQGANYTVKSIYTRLPDLQEVILSAVDEISWSTSRFKLVSRAIQKLENKQKNLHLGCYHRKIHGFINIDCRPEVQPDLLDDCAKLEKIENNSVDLIYTSHMMEHFKRDESLQALRRYREVLKTGGALYISVPDLEMVCRHYILHQDLRLLQNFLYGSQKHEADFHYTGWDFRTLKEDLESVGFTSVEKYDTWKTPWFYIDDYSKAYLEHMDFKKGTLMSLNIRSVAT